MTRNVVLSLSLTAFAVLSTIAQGATIDVANGSTDSWIISIQPDTTYNGTGTSFWDVRRSGSDVRYALASFDLSAFTGLTVIGVQMHVDELDLDDHGDVGSSSEMPIATEMFALNLDGSETPLGQQTWNTYQNQIEGMKDTLAFSSLGGFSLSAPGQSGGDERISVGDASDIATIQSLIDGSAALSIVLKPSAAGAQAASFGDDDSPFGFGPFLRITVVPEPSSLMLFAIGLACAWCYRRRTCA